MKARLRTRIAANKVHGALTGWNHTLNSDTSTRRYLVVREAVDVPRRDRSETLLHIQRDTTNAPVHVLVGEQAEAWPPAFGPWLYVPS